MQKASIAHHCFIIAKTQYCFIIAILNARKQLHNAHFYRIMAFKTNIFLFVLVSVFCSLSYILIFSINSFYPAPTTVTVSSCGNHFNLLPLQWALQYCLTNPSSLSLSTRPCKVSPLLDIRREVSFTCLWEASLPCFFQRVVELTRYTDK